MWLLLCLGPGRLPSAGRARPLSEAHRQMRPLLPARMPSLERAFSAARILLGL